MDFANSKVRINGQCAMPITSRKQAHTLCVLDAETASSAVRNLNGYELGGRQLRVDYADMDPAIEAQRQRERGGGGGGGHEVRNITLAMSLSISFDTNSSL